MTPSDTAEASLLADADRPTEGARPGRTAARVTPGWLSGTAVATVLVTALVKGLSPFYEPDVWWHLRVGDLVRSTTRLRYEDASATFAARPYVVTQWLPEAVASYGHAAFGMGFVLWLRVLAIVALVVVVYVACRRYAGRLPAAVVSGLVLVGAGGGLNPRPQLVSFVFFAITIHAWCGMATDRRPRWWLVPVFWLWASSHGLWTFGLMVGALVLAAVALDPVNRPGRREVARLSALWCGCLVAVTLTPLGPSLLLTPFHVAGNASMIADEWRATPLNNVFSWAALLIVTASALLWVTQPRRRAWWMVALLVFAGLCALWMWRLVPLGCIAAAPLLAGALQEHLSARREPFDRAERRGLLAASAVLVAVGAAVCAGPAGSGAQRYPGNLGSIDAALADLPPRTVVLNDFGMSGWLLWAHPQLAPVADLRGEIYSSEHLAAYQDVLAVKPGWQDFLATTRPEVALLQRKSALGDALVHRRGWTMVASTDEFILLRSGSP